jgi:hypothetical protein
MTKWMDPKRGVSWSVDADETLGILFRSETLYQLSYTPVLPMKIG